MSASRPWLLALILSVVGCGDDSVSNPTPKTERDGSTDAAEAASSQKESSSTQPESQSAGDEAAQKKDAQKGGEGEQAGPAKFYTEPVAEGYQRFEPPAIEVEPGDSDDWAQWVGGPLDQDYDVIDIDGTQSVGGHHALVYATTVAQRAWFGMARRR
jgi:hypothetical protein